MRTIPFAGVSSASRAPGHPGDAGLVAGSRSIEPFAPPNSQPGPLWIAFLPPAAGTLVLLVGLVSYGAGVVIRGCCELENSDILKQMPRRSLASPHERVREDVPTDRGNSHAASPGSRRRRRS